MTTDKPVSNRRVISRAEAARLLRAARRTLAGPDPDGGADGIGWTLLMLHDHRYACRIKIDYLYRVGNHESADALIARSILQDRDHPLIRWRYARSLHAQGRLEAAQREIRKVIAARPHHVAALVLASRIASELGHHEQVVELLSAALHGRPDDRRLRSKLVEALLRSGRADEAARHLERIPNAPALLHARVLRAQNRILESIEKLMQSIDADDASDESLGMMRELIETLEYIGDLPQLHRVFQTLAPVTQLPGGQDVRLRIASALLGIGQFEQASAMLTQLTGDLPIRNSALQHLTVCCALGGRTDQAAAVLQEWRGCGSHTGRHGPANHSNPIIEMAGLWLKGLLGTAIAGVSDARQAGSDPSLSVLQPMLREAVRTLHAAVKVHDRTGHHSDMVIEQHLAACLAATGRAPQPAESDASGGAADLHELPAGHEDGSMRAVHPARRAA